MSPGARPRRFLVVGGGCYGSHYARALARAADRGRLDGAEVWIVDRDPACQASRLAARPGQRLVTAEWDEFFAGYLEDWRQGAGRREEDLVVPAPLTPHLFARWIEHAVSAEAPAREVEPPFLPPLPFARLTGPRLVVSFAEWRCPTHCVEPALCPATRQPRTWDVSRALVSYACDLRSSGLAPLTGPLVARCTHLLEGVGVFPLADWAQAARRLMAAIETRAGGEETYALVATVSGCHGAATLLAATSPA